MGGRPAERERGASRGGEFVGGFSSDEDRVRHRTTNDSDFVARSVAPRVSVRERTSEGNVRQSDVEPGELSGTGCSSDSSNVAEGDFSSDDESDGEGGDSDDGVRGDSPTTADGKGSETCTPEGSNERAAEVAPGDRTSEARPATISKSTPDISKTSATRSPGSTAGEDAHPTEHGKAKGLVESLTPDRPTLGTTRAGSGEDPHSADLPLNQETETGSHRQQKHVANHANSAIVAGEKQGERVSGESPTQGGAAVVEGGYCEESVHESAPGGDGSGPEVRHPDDPMVDACVVSSVEGADEDETTTNNNSSNNNNNGAVDGRPENISGRGFMADLCKVGATTSLAEEKVAGDKGTAGACSARGENGGRASEESALCKDDRRYTRGKTRVSVERKGARSLRTEGTRRRRSSSPPTSSIPSCESSALRPQEDSGICAPRFGSDQLLHAAAHRRNKSKAGMSLPGSKAQVSSVFDPLTQKLEGAHFGGDSPHNPPSLPPRGTKRKKSAKITLAQVIDHHMARRRLNGVASTDGLPTQRDSLGRSTQGDTGGAKKVEEAHKKSPSSTRKELVDGSAVVAAAWANGCVLPLTATASSHMRLVAPLLAAEPEGRRIVVRTASAVAVGAAALALSDYRLEVTGVCRDGLLMELSPKVDFQGECVRESGQPMLPSTLGNRLQEAFDKVVALDLEFNTVLLPHAETLDAVPPGSSSGELLKWRNDGTSALLRLSRVSSTQTGLANAEVRNGGNSDMGEGGKGLSQLEEGCFLGIDSEMGPLLPRTGLLECFHVEIHAVPFPPSDYSAKDPRASHSSTVHLAMILSDSGVFGGGSIIAQDEGGGQVPSCTVASAQVPGGTVPNASGRSLRQLRARLCCVPPTRTEGGLAWREVMGFKCVAKVSRLAFASKAELEDKIQLVEGLHTAQVGGNVSAERFDFLHEAGCPPAPALRRGWE